VLVLLRYLPPDQPAPVRRAAGRPGGYCRPHPQLDAERGAGPAGTATAYEDEEEEARMLSDDSAPWMQFDAVIAVADLAGRAGAKQFQIGYLHDNVPVEEAAWYAHAQYLGTRLSVDNHRSPQDAALALAQRILLDGLCRCGRRVSLHGGVKGTCRWRLVGKRWESGCDAEAIGIDAAERGNLTAMQQAMRRAMNVRSSHRHPSKKDNRSGRRRR
jgi:hypothetical protein